MVTLPVEHNTDRSGTMSVNSSESIQVQRAPFQTQSACPIEWMKVTVSLESSSRFFIVSDVPFFDKRNTCPISSSPSRRTREEFEDGPDTHTLSDLECALQ